MQIVAVWLFSGNYSLLQRTGFSLWWLLWLQSRGLGHLSFSSCGTWAYLARGIFLDQGSNLCLLHSPVDDLPLRHPGKPSHPLFSAAAFYKTQTILYTILRFLTYNVFRNISDQQSVRTNPA